MPHEPAHDLLSVSADSYGSHYREHFLEQYKLYVDSADRISQRRSSTNSFMLTVNASLVALDGLASSLTLRGASAWHLLVPIAGVFVCIAWLSLVQSYRNLNTVKFEVIHALEEMLPVRLYAYEWNLSEKGQGKRYKPVSHIEQWIPFAFILLYVGLMVYSFIS